MKTDSQSDLESRLHNLMYGLFYPAVLGTIFFTLLPFTWQFLLVLWRVFSGLESFNNPVVIKWFLAIGIVGHFSVDYFFSHHAPTSRWRGFLIDFGILIALSIAALNLSLPGTGGPALDIVCFALGITYSLFLLWIHVVQKQLREKRPVVIVEFIGLGSFFIIAGLAFLCRLGIFHAFCNYLWVLAVGGLYLMTALLGWAANKSLKAYESTKGSKFDKQSATQ